MLGNWIGSPLNLIFQQNVHVSENNGSDRIE